MPAVEAYEKFTAKDVVRLRHELGGWLDRGGIDYYQLAVDNGSQHVLLEDVYLRDQAEALAVAEADAARRADLYFIDNEMCDLVAAAHPSMPAFAPIESDLPCQFGFTVFARPVAVVADDPIGRGDRVLVGEDLKATNYLSPTQIVAASWRPYTQSAARLWANGGVWLTFYTYSPAHLLKPLARSFSSPGTRTGSWPTLTPDQEQTFAWYNPSTDGDDKPWLIQANSSGSAAMARAVLATFQLARQDTLAHIDLTRIPQRPVKKAKARKGLRPTPAGDVRIVRLRGNASDQGISTPTTGKDPAGRSYRHRWVVRGFWRNTWYGSLGVNRPQWIAPHIKGPAGAPLLGGDKVMLVSPPRPNPMPPAATQRKSG